MHSAVRRTPGGGTAVALEGELDFVNVDELRDVLVATVAGSSGQVVVDLAGVTFVDLVSLSAILAVADSLREHGRSLVVVNSSRQVRKMCALLNADDVLAPTLPTQGNAFTG